MKIAELENIQKVSRLLHFSPSKVSKVLLRIEAELGTQLFDREGKSIKLNKQGAIFYTEGSKTINLFEKACLLTQKGQAEFKIRIASSSGLFYEFTKPTMDRILQSFPKVNFDITTVCTPDIYHRLQNGEFDLAITAQSGRPYQLSSKKMGVLELAVLASKHHPMAKSRKTFEMKDILENDFVVPYDRFFGPHDRETSGDGWKDDIYPRKAKYSSDSFQAMLEIIESGAALGFLPKAFADRDHLKIIKTEKLPFSSQFSVFAVCRDKNEFGWSRLVF